MNLWEISVDECGKDANSVMSRGNIYQLANGYMGYRGTLDEFGSKELVGVTLAGLFDRVGEAWREPVNAPNAGYTQVELDGVALSALENRVRSHRQRLNLANASFERETVFEVEGKLLSFKSTRFLSAANPHLGVIRIEVSCDAPASLKLRTGIDGEVWDLNGPHLPLLQRETRDGVLLTHGLTHESGKCVAVAESIASDCGTEEFVTPDQKNLRCLSWSAEAGKRYTFDKFFAVATDNDAFDTSVPDAAVHIARNARKLGFERCLSKHEDIWSGKWANSDVVIEGDDEAQRALRYSIFQLLMVAPVQDSANSIPARALSGQVYKGAIFWDTEMFMYPFFLHTDPSVAVELLRYRIKTLDGARRKARSEGSGYRGAFYAWESQETGDDACSYFNVGDPITGRELRTHFRDKQVHISGDVAIAMWSYFEHTGDDSLLLEGGAEVILECARFYYSYAYFKKDKNRYEILDVIGPDEYHERVNNNAFTSQVAKETFRIALAAVEHLKAKHPQALARLLEKIGIEKELEQFAEAYTLLYLPQPDPETKVIEQFDGYFKLQESTVEALNAKRVHPNEYLGAGQGLAVPTQVIKQADVVMMLNLFKGRFDSETKKANWEFYEPRTEHGSSLSACAYAMVALEFGYVDFAYRYFLKTAKIDLEAKYKLYAGTVFIGGSHPAANGGAWMTAVFGFAGISVEQGRLAIRPRLHPSWSRLQIPLVFRGDRFVVTLTQEEVTVATPASNAATHTVSVEGVLLSCSPGTRVSTGQVAVGAKEACI